MSRKRFSIRRKVVIGFTCCIVALVSLISGIIGLRIRKENENSFNQNMSQELSYIGEGISIFFSDTRNTLAMLASNEDVRNADDTIHSYADERGAIKASETVKSETEKSLVTLFKNVLSSFPEYVEVYIGTKWGGYATSFDGEMSGGYDPRKRGWYELALSANGSPVLTKAFASTVGDVVVGLSRSVYDNSNSFIGNVSIEVTLKTLTELISHSKIGTTGYVMMVQDDGVILADPRHPDFNFKTLTETGIEDFRKLASIDSGTVKLQMEGKKWMANVYTVRNPNWKLVAFMQESEVFSEFLYMMRTMFVLSFVMLVIFAVIVSVFTLRLLKPVSGIMKMLETIAEGDFTNRLPVVGSDEFSVLSDKFNHAMENIQKAMISVNTNTEQMKVVGDSLAANMTQTACSINQIHANIDEVKNQTQTQAASVTETTATMVEIIGSIGKLNSSVEQQSSKLSESSASVQKMLSSMDSISGVLDENKALIQALFEKTSVGKVKVQEANKVAAKIAEESTHLLEASTVIQNVASNTNLLAMNAAIEAAHVGENGKGFAVVSDEIRKLAQDSDSQGKHIASVIQESLDIIRQLAEAEKEAEQVFSEVYMMAEAVMQKQEMLVNVINEQSSGNREMLGVISELNSINDQVRNGSAEMLLGSETVAREMQNLDKLTVDISDRMNEMSSGVEQINSSIQEVNGISQRNKESISELFTEVNKFKV